MLMYPETPESIILSEELKLIEIAEHMDRYYNRTQEQIVKDRERDKFLRNNMSDIKKKKYNIKKIEWNRNYRERLTEKQKQIIKIKQKEYRLKQKNSCSKS